MKIADSTRNANELDVATDAVLTGKWFPIYPHSTQCKTSTAYATTILLLTARLASPSDRTVVHLLLRQTHPGTA